MIFTITLKVTSYTVQKTNFHVKRRQSPQVQISNGSLNTTLVPLVVLIKLTTPACVFLWQKNWRLRTKEIVGIYKSCKVGVEVGVLLGVLIEHANTWYMSHLSIALYKVSRCSLAFHVMYSFLCEEDCMTWWVKEKFVHISYPSTFWKTSQFRVVQPRRASIRELSAFHSMDYLECLEQVTNCDDCEEVENSASEYGLGMLKSDLMTLAWFGLCMLWFNSILGSTFVFLCFCIL